MRTTVIGLLVLFLAGCQPEATTPASATASRVHLLDSSGPALAVVTVPDDRRDTLWLVTPNGARQLSTDGSPAVPLPNLPADTAWLRLAELSGAGLPEVVAVGPGRVTALELDGSVRWQSKLPEGSLYGVATGDLNGGGRDWIALAGGPPIGLTVLAEDGATAFCDPTVRTAFGVAIRAAAEAQEGRVASYDDAGLLQLYDAVGTTLRRRTIRLAATDLAMLGERLLLLGADPAGRESDAAVIALSPTLEPAWNHPKPAGALPEAARDALVPGDYDGGGTPELVVVDGDGVVTRWTDDGSTTELCRLDGIPLCTAVGPHDERGRRSLLVGTGSGLYQVAVEP